MKRLLSSKKELLPPVYPDSLRMNGRTGRLAENITHGWLIGLKESNPAIIDMFRDRDTQPYRKHLSWAGEYAGKHLTGAYYIYLLTRSEVLRADIEAFIDDLLTCQDSDGYLGCFSRECRLTGAFSQNPSVSGCAWDAWNHYHIMTGMFLWYGITEKKEYLDAVIRAADLFLKKFYNGKPTVASIGSCEMNFAVYHIFVMLYRFTQEVKYLFFARKIENDMSSEGMGNHIENALNGLDFYKTSWTRWENLHFILGVTEMYLATGESWYLKAADHIVRSIMKTDVHNTGAFSTQEQAIGTPYTTGHIETCCVVAFNALVMRVATISGDPSLLDFLEHSYCNAVLGYYNPSGRWSTYDTPMDGFKWPSFHTIGFQIRPGSPMLNCCSVNAPRGVGELSRWMFTESDGILCINYYESFDAVFGDTQIVCESNYPAPSVIRITVSGSLCPVKLRIPSWSKVSSVTVDGTVSSAEPGSWFTADGTEILVNLDFSPRFQDGEQEYAKKTSIFSGPVLYGFDSFMNPDLDIRTLPAIHASRITSLPEVTKDGSIHWLADGVTLCDFYHLGVSGSGYSTWLNIIH